MVNSWYTLLVLSVVVFDLNNAAVRERRGLFFGNNDQTTTKPIIKSPFGTFQISLAGGTKAPEDPCNPSQNTQQGGRKPLINIKIPTLFGRGGNQNTPAPVECTTVTESPTTQSPPPVPTSSVPIVTLPPKPLPPSPLPPKPTPLPTPTTSGQLISSSTVDPDDELIDSIFGEESPPTTQNNGAGLLDLRKPLN